MIRQSSMQFNGDLSTWPRFYRDIQDIKLDNPFARDHISANSIDRALHNMR
jgi:hypothetical protein